MEICECNDGVKIIHSWFSKWTIVLSVAVGIYVYLIFRGGMGFFTDYEHDLFLAEMVISMSLPVIFVMLIACWLNQTLITIGDLSIEIRSFPLPFPARRTLAADDIIDVYARNNLNPSSMFQRKSFEIHALNDKGVQKAVLGFIANSKQAEMISRELKKIVCKGGQRSSSKPAVNGTQYG